MVIVLEPVTDLWVIANSYLNERPRLNIRLAYFYNWDFQHYPMFYISINNSTIRKQKKTANFDSNV